MSRFFKAILFSVACLTAATPAHSRAQIPAATLTQANQDLQAGEVDKALALLTPLPQSGDDAAEAQNLLCRVNLMIEQWDAALKQCQQAVNLDSKSSIDHMWLGRALGGKASHVSFLTAYSLAKRLPVEFQAAVQLDPKNAAALSDLGDFYRSAPGMVGGGTDKATAVAAQLDKVDPARANQLRGKIAEGSKDFVTAENDMKQAIAVSSHPAAQWVNLAQFYQRRKRWTDMDTAINNCVSAAAKDSHVGVPLYDGAGLLIATNRNSALAVQMLENYLAGSAKSEEAPAFIAHIRLGRLKQQLGDAAGAESEFAAASAMAHEYNPAQDSPK